MDAITEAVDYAARTNQCATVSKIISRVWVFVLIYRFSYLIFTPPMCQRLQALPKPWQQ